MTGAPHPGKKIYLASLTLSMALCVVLFVQDAATYTVALGALGGLAVVGLLTPAGAGRVLLALGVANLVTVVPELGLRAAGFSYESGIQFGYPTPDLFWHLVPDDELFWTLPPEDAQVNSLGFLGEEPAEPKPAGATRLLFLGDSCTQQGYPEAYPDVAVQVLRAKGAPVERVNLSMAGYTSHQGRVLARRYGARLQPDVVFVYYGWNDHWLAYGAIDAEKGGSLKGERLYRRSRLLQAARRLGVSMGFGSAAERLDVTRVPIDRYRQNLEAIAGSFEELDVPVVFVTAPTSHELLGVPEYLMKDGFANDAGAVRSLHREYNEATRSVARERGALLLDLAADFESGEDLRSVFTEDGIHLSERGRQAVARRVIDFARREGLVPGSGGARGE